MANPDKDVKKAEQQSQDQGGHVNEASPNPQGQIHIAETPVRTDHSDATGGDNVAQSTSTRDGALNPSVADHVSGHVRENDSMFNNADPQTAAIRKLESRERESRERETKTSESKEKEAGTTSKPRKGAA